MKTGMYQQEANYEHLVRPQVELLSGRELAWRMARCELIAARPSRNLDELGGLLPLARTLGVSVAEAQLLTGFSRQSLYAVINAQPIEAFRDRDTERLARLLNIAIVAAGEQKLEQIAAAMNVSPGILVAPAQLLATQGLARFRLAGRDGEEAVLAPTELSNEWLRLHASCREVEGRGPGFSVFIRVAPEDVGRIDAAVGDIAGFEVAAIVPGSTAPGVMDGPELVITLRATDQRAALRGAEEIWTEIAARVGGLPALRVTDLRPPAPPPNAASAVLDAFVDALTWKLEEGIDIRIHGEREHYDGRAPERVLAGRCLTLAARELRRELGREPTDRIPAISDGDAAFDEWNVIRSSDCELPDEQFAGIRRPLLAALELAARCLGPFRGGELAAVRARPMEPRKTREVAPSEEDLTEMARLCGEAIAAGQGDDRHLLAVTRTLLGRCSA
jgi:hypothetical protein